MKNSRMSQKIIRISLLMLALPLMSACNNQSQDTADAKNNNPAASSEVADIKNTAPQKTSLQAVLEAQPDGVKARYSARNPQATIEYFGIKPGMTVVEALPGGGWYSKILLPYLGPNGKLIGADYAIDMYPLFGFFNEKQLKAKETWVTDWVDGAQDWDIADAANMGAFHFGSMPSEFQGKADVVIFVRALHNLSRFESQGQYLTKALNDAHSILKPNGIVGVVQHKAPESATDEWADGSKGYLKQSQLIKRFEDAGFELVSESDINRNPTDKPTGDDIVWRLPPSLVTSREDPELKAKYQEIGESDRMTLLFRKIVKAPSE